MEDSVGDTHHSLPRRRLELLEEQRQRDGRERWGRRQHAAEGELEVIRRDAVRVIWRRPERDGEVAERDVEQFLLISWL